MPTKKRIPANKIDRDVLHSYLRRNANHRGRVTVKLGELADDLGIRSDHLSRILIEMAAAGRMRRISSSNLGVLFSVRDFDEWARETGYRRPRQ